jgi:methylenetetrahydrofolate dehydrogenase (NADP+)/methenyltetrahydrofolate cyclohydrolase
LDGRRLADRARQQLLPVIAQVVSSRGRPPGLGVVLVGEDGPSVIYVRNKIRTATALGLVSRVLRLPANVDQQGLLSAIDALNADDAIDAFLLQLPLPKHLDAQQALLRIAPHKDADALHPALCATAAQDPDAVLPCTPAGCLRLIEEVQPQLTGCHAVVVGRSQIVGQPMARLLLARNCTVTICHRHTRDLPRHTRMADILVVAAGVPHLIGGADIQPGAVVIDVGIHRIQTPEGESRLIGDVDTEAALEVARAVTPVPGGVGPMTIAMLMHNAVRAACRTLRSHNH